MSDQHKKWWGTCEVPIEIIHAGYLLDVMKNTAPEHARASEIICIKIRTHLNNCEEGCVEVFVLGRELPCGNE